tara:strand:- start:786 stop:1160 length:375 start_codon:yes stop_codon:yes gene_type:complete
MKKRKNKKWRQKSPSQKKMEKAMAQPEIKGNISLADIANAVQIIDVCTGRGAVQGQELSSVGGVRDRLQAFVDANKPPEGAVPPSVGEAPPADVGLETAEETVVDFPEPHQVEEPLVEEETTEG